MGTETPSQGTFRYSLRNIPPKAEWDVPAMQKAYKAALADGSLCDGEIVQLELLT